MQEPKKENEREKDELKVEWIGADGAFVLLYIVLACIYGYGLLHSIDFVIGIMAPGIAIVITVGVFLKYCTEVFSFASGKKGKDTEDTKKD